jgi:hypothetical protein
LIQSRNVAFFTRKRRLRRPIPALASNSKDRELQMTQPSSGSKSASSFGLRPRLTHSIKAPAHEKPIPPLPPKKRGTFYTHHSESGKNRRASAPKTAPKPSSKSRAVAIAFTRPGESRSLIVTRPRTRRDDLAHAIGAPIRAGEASPLRGGDHHARVIWF